MSMLFINSSIVFNYKNNIHMCVLEILHVIYFFIMPAFMYLWFFFWSKFIWDK